MFSSLIFRLTLSTLLSKFEINSQSSLNWTETGVSVPSLQQRKIHYRSFAAPSDEIETGSKAMPDVEFTVIKRICYMWTIYEETLISAEK